MINKLCNILVSIILAAVLAIVAALMLPRLAGYQVYGVLSGSMEPHFHVGSVVYVKESGWEEVNVGDPITFRLPSDNTLVATHRVIEIDTENQAFITKGDANDVADKDPIPFGRLIGRAVFSIPYLGFLSMFLQTKQGILAGIAVLLLVIVLLLLGSLAEQKQKQQRTKTTDSGNNDHPSEKKEESP